MPGIIEKHCVFEHCCLHKRDQSINGTGEHKKTCKNIGFFLICVLEIIKKHCAFEPLFLHMFFQQKSIPRYLKDTIGTLGLQKVLKNIEVLSILLPKH